MDLRNAHFYCPITEEVMRDPVIDPEGNSYEREAITKWLSVDNTSPITRTRLTIDQLIPNRSLRKAIEDEQLAMDKETSAERKTDTVADSNSSVDTNTLEERKPTLSLSIGKGSNSHQFELLASITPPVNVANARVGCDVCCVVDVSGSMGGDASIIGVENSGLSLLDVVKHALKTIITSLQPVDRLSLVSYSNSAKVVCGLTPMTAAGKGLVLGLVETLEPDGMTNLWDGLKKGLDSLSGAATTMSSDSSPCVRNAAVFLLTDGEPNVEPPRGHIPMLKLYREKHQGKLPATVSTFGFGYGVKSLLLRDIALVGGGMYAFIPDSGFVGTAFVNALANQLATLGSHATLSLDLPDGFQLSEESSLLVQSSSNLTSWGVTVDLGSIKYGQKKDVVFRITYPAELSLCDALAAFDILASLKYTPLSMHGAVDENTITSNAILQSSEENESYVDVQKFRSEVVILIIALLDEKLASDNVSTTTLHSLIARMKQWLQSHPKRQDLPYTTVHFDLVDGLMKDLSGQVREAVHNEYFLKWGRHYLPSLARAHQLQECLNFKDPGVLLYGGELFQTQRDLADDAFNNLPAPTPSVRNNLVYRNISSSRSGSASSNISRTPVSMSAFNSASAPCFHGDCLVHMKGGSLKTVSSIKSGDYVSCNNHCETKSSGREYFARVDCVVKTVTKEGTIDLVNFADGLRVTPYHPIFDFGDCNTDNKKWHFPIDSNNGKLCHSECTAVFSFVLGPPMAIEKDDEYIGNSRASSMLINKINCITLAHEITDDLIASHDFYGTERVLEALQMVNKEAYENGGSGFARRVCDKGSCFWTGVWIPPSIIC